MATFLGTYAGVVEENKDPEKLGRVKIRVPHVFGPASINGSISTKDLPWALPTGLPSGGTTTSGGLSWIPGVGDHVFVRFLDGEPEKPIYEWGMQDQTQGEGFPFHGYTKDETNSGPTAPDKTILTRFQHAIQLDSTGIIATTRAGYALLLTDATELGTDGSIILKTPKQVLEFDDSTDQATLFVNNFSAAIQDYFYTLAGSKRDDVTTYIKTQCLQGPINFIALTDFTVDSDTVRLTAATNILQEVGTQSILLDDALVQIGASTTIMEMTPANASLTVSGDTTITSGTITITGTESILISCGGRTLSISPLGFNFL